MKNKDLFIKIENFLTINHENNLLSIHRHNNQNQPPHNSNNKNSTNNTTIESCNDSIGGCDNDNNINDVFLILKDTKSTETSTSVNQIKLECYSGGNNNLKNNNQKFLFFGDDQKTKSLFIQEYIFGNNKFQHVNHHQQTISDQKQDLSSFFSNAIELWNLFTTDSTNSSIESLYTITKLNQKNQFQIFYINFFLIGYPNVDCFNSNSTLKYNVFQKEYKFKESMEKVVFDKELNNYIIFVHNSIKIISELKYSNQEDQSLEQIRNIFTSDNDFIQFKSILYNDQVVSVEQFQFLTSSISCEIYYLLIQSLNSALNEKFNNKFQNNSDEYELNQVCCIQILDCNSNHPTTDNNSISSVFKSKIEKKVFSTFFQLYNYSFDTSKYTSSSSTNNDTDFSILDSFQSRKIDFSIINNPFYSPLAIFENQKKIISSFFDIKSSQFRSIIFLDSHKLQGRESKCKFIVDSLVNLQINNFFHPSNNSLVSSPSPSPSPSSSSDGSFLSSSNPIRPRTIPRESSFLSFSSFSSNTLRSSVISADDLSRHRKDSNATINTSANKKKGSVFSTFSSFLKKNITSPTKDKQSPHQQSDLNTIVDSTSCVNIHEVSSRIKPTNNQSKIYHDASTIKSTTSNQVLITIKPTPTITPTSPKQQPTSSPLPPHSEANYYNDLPPAYSDVFNNQDITLIINNIQQQQIEQLQEQQNIQQQIVQNKPLPSLPVQQFELEMDTFQSNEIDVPFEVEEIIPKGSNYNYQQEVEAHVEIKIHSPTKKSSHNDVNSIEMHDISYYHQEKQQMSKEVEHEEEVNYEVLMSSNEFDSRFSNNQLLLDGHIDVETFKNIYVYRNAPDSISVDDISSFISDLLPLKIVQFHLPSYLNVLKVMKHITSPSDHFDLYKEITASKSSKHSTSSNEDDGFNPTSCRIGVLSKSNLVASIMNKFSLCNQPELRLIFQEFSLVIINYLALLCENVSMNHKEISIILPHLTKLIKLNPPVEFYIHFAAAVSSIHNNSSKKPKKQLVSQFKSLSLINNIIDDLFLNVNSFKKNFQIIQILTILFKNDKSTKKSISEYLKVQQQVNFQNQFVKICQKSKTQRKEIGDLLSNYINFDIDQDEQEDGNEDEYYYENNDEDDQDYYYNENDNEEESNSDEDYFQEDQSEYAYENENQDGNGNQDDDDEMYYISSTTTTNNNLKIKINK